MFTQDSRKSLLAISAILSAIIVYVAVIVCLQAIAAWAERDLHAFPFKEEDWLRYLLPSRFESRDKQKIMLTGPSTVRENLRYERFEAAFPAYEISQGGISAGTLEDVTAALEYIEKVYGRSALPTIIVLGISPRIVANIPDDRPFTLGLNRYSPYFSGRQESASISLIHKGTLDGALARVRFLVQKEQWRFRTGFQAVVLHAMSKVVFTVGGRQWPLGKSLDRLFKTPTMAKLIDILGHSRASKFTFSEILQWMISPYKYSLNSPIQYRLMTREEYRKGDLNSVWRQLYDWDPRETELVVRMRLKNFANFVKRHGIQTLVINLPERDFSRVLFLEENYQKYLDMISDEFKGMEFVNFREFLDTADFYDREHTTPDGSAKLSDEVIRLMRAGILPQRQLQVEQGE